MALNVGSVETIRDLIPDIPPLALMLAVCGDGEVYNQLLTEGRGRGFSGTVSSFN